MIRKLFLLLCFTSIFYHTHLLRASENSAPTNKDEPTSDIYKQWDLETQEKAEKEGERFTELWKKTLMFLTIMVVFLVLATWAMKRFSRVRLGFDTKQARIRITDRKLLSNKSCLYIVTIDEQELVVAESPNGVQLLTHLAPKKTD